MMHLGVFFKVWLHAMFLAHVRYRDFVNTRLLVHKHVKISVDEWILETTRPQKHVKFLEQYIP